MTPKEKAKQLYDKMEFETKYNSQPSTVHGMCKKLALVCVDEILKSIKKDSDFTITYDKAVKYWSEVKEEINKL